MAWKLFIFVMRKTGEKIFSYYHQLDGEDGHRLLPCPNHPGEEICCPECKNRFNKDEAEVTEIEVDDYWIHIPFYGKFLYDFYLSQDIHVHTDGSQHPCFKEARKIHCKGCNESFDPQNDYGEKAILWGKSQLPAIGEIKYYLFKGASIWLSYRDEKNQERFAYLDPNTEVLGEAMPYRNGLLLCPDRDIEQVKGDLIFQVEQLPSIQIFEEVNAFKSKIDQKLGDKQKTLPIDMQAIVMGELGNVIDSERQKTHEIEAELPNPEEGIPQKPKSFRTGKTREMPSGSNDVTSSNSSTLVIKANHLHTGEYELIDPNGENPETFFVDEQTPPPEPTPLLILSGDKKPDEKASAEETERVATLDLPALPDAEETKTVLTEEEEVPPTTVDSEEWDDTEIPPEMPEEENDGYSAGDDSDAFISEETANIDPSDFSQLIDPENQVAFESGLKELEEVLAESDSVDDEQFAQEVMNIIEPFLQSKLANLILQLESRSADIKNDINSERLSVATVLQAIAKVTIPKNQFEIILDWSKRLLDLEERYEERLASSEKAIQEKIAELQSSNKNSLETLNSELQQRLQEISILWEKMLKNLHEEMEEAHAQQIKEHKIALETIRADATAENAQMKLDEEERLLAEENAFKAKIFELEAEIDKLQKGLETWSDNHFAESKRMIEQVNDASLEASTRAIKAAETEAVNSLIEDQTAFKEHMGIQQEEMAKQHGENLAAYDDRLKKTAAKLNKATKARWKITLPILLGIFFAGSLFVLIYSSVVSHDQGRKNAQQRAKLDRQYQEKITLMEKEAAERKDLGRQLQSQQRILAKLQSESQGLKTAIKKSLALLSNWQKNGKKESRKIQELREKMDQDWLQEKLSRRQDFSAFSNEMRLMRDYYNVLLQRQTGKGELNYWNYLLLSLKKQDNQKVAKKLDKLQKDQTTAELNFEKKLNSLKQSLKKLMSKNTKLDQSKVKKLLLLQTTLETQLNQLRQMQLDLKKQQPCPPQNCSQPKPRTSLSKASKLPAAKKGYSRPKRNPISIRIIDSTGRVLKKIQ